MLTKGLYETSHGRGFTVNGSLPKNMPSILTTRFLNVDPAHQSPL